LNWLKPRLRAEIRTNAEKTSRQEVSAEARKAHHDQIKAFSTKTWKPARDPYFERARLTRREQRYDRYQQAMDRGLDGEKTW
jgi:hypothetical protein